jgi:hypothetical protein
MQFFYDGQIRRYLLQTMRLFSNFVVKYGDGRLMQVPVMYGDQDKQVATILRQNSENKVNSMPKIAVYISNLEMDKERLADPTFVGKVHIRERAIEDGEYTSAQGSNYTVERLMPSPYKLTVKVDIWTGSTEQKLQILEQILMLFNPSLEIQTTENFVDWTSLSVVYLDQVDFSSRSIPVGAEIPIDIASLTVSMPIWISPPAKIKKLGVVNSILMSMYTNIGAPATGYIDGFGQDPNEGTRNLYDVVPIPVQINVVDYDIIVFGGCAKVYQPNAAGKIINGLDDPDLGSMESVNWEVILLKHPNTYTPGESKIFLRQFNGNEVVGTIAIDPFDYTCLNINWDPDTYPSNTDISSSLRPNSPGTFDAIIDPQTKGPGSGLPLPTAGTRYLIINSIGAGIRETIIAENSSNRIDTTVDFDLVDDVKIFVNDSPVSFNIFNVDNKLVIRLNQNVAVDDVILYILNLNSDGPDAWKNSDGTDFIANANDIIEWTGSRWQVIFDSTTSRNVIRYLTNIYTNVQYRWDGISWTKSFEGLYRKGDWRLIL